MKAFYTKKKFEQLLQEAMNGEASSQYALGYIYETGNISDMTEDERRELINLYEALDWYESASIDGWSVAQEAVLRVRGFIEANVTFSSEQIEEYISLAEEGSLDGLYVAGCGLLRGQQGWMLNPKAGEKYLKRATEMGSAQAAKSLAHYYAFCPSPSFLSKEKCLEYCDIAEKMGGNSSQIEELRDLIRLGIIF